MVPTRDNDRVKKGKTRRSQPKRGRMENAAQVAHVLAHRDDYVAQGLAWLGRLGVLDVPSQKRLWERYQEGDQATRRLLQEQVARVLGTAAPPEGPRKRSEARDPSVTVAGEGPESVDPLELDTLKQLSLPQVDPAAVAQEVRRFDPVRWFGEAKEPGPVMRFFSEAPLTVHHLQRRLLWTGVSLLVFVVALVTLAVFVPAVVPWVGLGGVVLLALFFGFLLLRAAFWVDRSAKQQGIDLEVYAQLPDDERRLLLMRRIGLRLFDPERISKAVERGLRHGLPEGMQAPPERTAAAPRDPGSEPEHAHDDGPPPRPRSKADPEVGTRPEPPVPREPPGEPDDEELAADGPGRVSRLWTQTHESLQRAARSPAAKKAGREVAQRARSAGAAAREQLGGLRERGARELERTKGAVEKRRRGRSKAAGKKGTGMTQRRKQATKKQVTNKRSGTTKKAAKEAVKKTRGKTGKKGLKKSSAKKQGARKKAAKKTQGGGKKTMKKTPSKSASRRRS